MGSKGAPNLLQNLEKLASSITNNLQHQSNNASTFREIKIVNVTLNNIGEKGSWQYRFVIRVIIVDCPTN